VPRLADSATSRRTGPRPAIVLEHGPWAGGSGWAGVIQRLQRRGYTVDAPPDPLRDLAFDSSHLADYLSTITGPIILVGPSYGGAVTTTNAATGKPNLKALVYVDAFTPAQGRVFLAARRCPARVLPRHPGPRLDQSRTGPGRGRHDRGPGRRGPGGPSWQQARADRLNCGPDAVCAYDNSTARRGHPRRGPGSAARAERPGRVSPSGPPEPGARRSGGRPSPRSAGCGLSGGRDSAALSWSGPSSFVSFVSLALRRRDELALLVRVTESGHARWNLPQPPGGTRVPA